MASYQEHSHRAYPDLNIQSLLLQNLDVLDDVMALNPQIQILLRSPDEVKIVLEATFVTAAGESDSRRDPQNRRILAVVSHKDDWDLTEEGT